MVYKYSTHCFPLDCGSEYLQRRKKKLVRFRTRLQDERRRQNCFARVTLGFEISRERQGLLLQSRKMAKRWQSSWKTIETTAESSLTSFLASGRGSFLPRSGQACDEVARGPAPYKNRMKYCFESLFSGKEASRKTSGTGLLSIFPGKCRTFKKCIE